MGCTGSKPATPEECEVICAHMGKVMLTICIDPALNQVDKIKVPLPSDFDNVKKAVDQLKDMAARAGADKADGEAEKAPEEAKTGGMGGLMNKASQIASQAADAVAGAAAAGTSAGLNAIASSLEKSIAAFEEPMAKIAKDVIAAKREDIVRILKAHINDTKFSCDAVSLCKGPANALSEDMIVKGAPDMGKQFVNSVDEFLTQSAVVHAWNKMIGVYNDAVNVGKQVAGDKLPLKGIQLNIKEYIEENIFVGIGKEIGEIEAEIRAKPENQAVSNPMVFAAVFRGVVLTAADHKAVVQESGTKE